MYALRTMIFVCMVLSLAACGGATSTPGVPTSNLTSPPAATRDTATAVQPAGSPTASLAPASPLPTTTPIPTATQPPPSPTPAPFLPGLLEAIDPGNAAQMQSLASIGTGRNFNLRFSADSQYLAVDAGIGPLVYTLASLTPASTAIFDEVFPGGPERWVDGQATRIYTRAGEVIAAVWNTSGNYEQGVSADGSLLAAIGQDPPQIEIWDLVHYTGQAAWLPDSTGRIATLREFSKLGCGVSAGDGPGAGGNSFNLLAVHPAGPLPLLAGVCNNERLLFFSSAGELYGELSLPAASSISVMAFSPDGSQLAGLVSQYEPSEQQRLLVWSVPDGAQLQELPIPDEVFSGWPLPTLALSPDHRWLALGLDDGRLLLWDTTAPGEALELQPAAPDTHALAFSPGGTTLAYATRQSAILVSLPGGEPSLALDVGSTAEFGGCGALLFSPDGRYLVCEGANPKAWDLQQSGQPATALDAGVHLSFLDDPVRLAGVRENGLVLSVPPGWKAVETIPTSNKFNRMYRFSPDGKRLALAFTNDELHVLEPGGKKWETRISFEDVQAAHLSFSADGELLAACTAPIEAESMAALSVFSLETNEQIYRLRMEFPIEGDQSTPAACSYAFSPDGLLLATGAGHQLKLYSAASGAQLVTLPGHAGIINAVRFSPDGALLATLGADGVIRLWGVPAP